MGGNGWGSSTTSQRFQYDAANRLVKVKADDKMTVIASYTYGADNQRLVAEEFAQGTSTRTYYVAEGLSAIGEYLESGGSVNPAWSKSYVHLGNRLLSTLTPNGVGGEAVEHHHPDQLGTRLVTNPATGTSFEEATLPFGTALAAESTGATNRRFTSYDRSTITSLDYAVNRHYDPQQGRFTQVDPIGMGGSTLASPQSFNLYAYCINDPVNFVDPSGLMADYLCEMYGMCGGGGTGADRGWGSVSSGFWGGGVDMNARVSPTGSSGRQTIIDAEYDHDYRYYDEYWGPFRFRSAFVMPDPFLGFAPNRDAAQPLDKKQAERRLNECLRAAKTAYETATKAAYAAYEATIGPLLAAGAIGGGLGGYKRSPEDRLQNATAGALIGMLLAVAAAETTKKGAYAAAESSRSSTASNCYDQYAKDLRINRRDLFVPRLNVPSGLRPVFRG